MKRFFLEFDFEPHSHAELLAINEPRISGGVWDYTRQRHCADHTWFGQAKSFKTVKGYISYVKKTYPTQKPHNFRIFDLDAPEEPCGHVGEVYFQAV